MFERWAEKFKDKDRKMQEEEEIQFREFEESVDNSQKSEPAPTFDTPPSSIEGSNIELKVVRPESFAEVSTIADHLIEGCTVVLNVELLDRTTTVRMLDFLNGVTYTKDGEIKNVAPNTFIITPNGVDIHD